MQIELVGKVLFFVLRLHHKQIVANHSLREHIESLKDLVRAHLEEHRNVLGFNMAGLKHIKHGRRNMSKLVKIVKSTLRVRGRGCSDFSEAYMENFKQYSQYVRSISKLTVI